MNRKLLTVLESVSDLNKALSRLDRQVARFSEVVIGHPGGPAQDVATAIVAVGKKTKAMSEALDALRLELEAKGIV